MSEVQGIPLFPEPLRFLLRPLPLFPLRLALNRVVARFAAERPAIFRRLGSHAEKVYLIDAVDLPFIFRLRPSAERPSIDLCRRAVSGARLGPWDARIAGPLAALLGMIHGSFDGDALFFSRDIVVEGDTEAVLALRNALDDAEIDLLSEAARLLGPAGGVVERVGRGVLSEAGRLTGVSLVRAES
ncbi:ubiquinone anaerobic biosynthesis accessory factor UbiT [Pelagibius marinus]|uniref:ubiquinone anaerobic biosynthesis accessory factor UbiT n=1 Tax=Pelagibius marinus TaxID=2762760 RepID=UPI0018731D9A|nr:SCP2 sterol-binding domain-containing protein [Pelagibius marinus]